MNGKLQNDKIILGLKVRQLRTDKGLSLSELNKKAGMSISYLNEIEKGKKYPRQDKLNQLAEALGVSAQQLASKELPSKLEPVIQLLNSNFLNDLPLDLFKIELVKVVDIIANAPAQVGAFISTLVELSKNYALQQESFYFAALRSYLELHNNYFDQLENEVQRFIKQYELPATGLIPSESLAEILEKRFGYEIIDDGLDRHPDLKNFRAVFLPKSKQLLLNSQLTDRQRAFQFGKELGFNFLRIKERANTSSLLRANSFNEVLNHSKGIYFSVALLMNERDFVKDLTQFFQKEEWDGDSFLAIMYKYGASPEMFYHRLTNILPKAFGLDKLFFIRFVHKTKDDHFQIDRELHLDDRRHLHRNELSEHYCRRWVAISSLKDLKAQQPTPAMDVAIQRSQYYETKDEYLCFTISRSAYPTPNKNVSVTLGIHIDRKLKKQINFLKDHSILSKTVNKTCERCPIKNCEERVAEPIVVKVREKGKRIQRALDRLMEE